MGARSDVEQNQPVAASIERDIAGWFELGRHIAIATDERRELLGRVHREGITERQHQMTVADNDDLGVRGREDFPGKERRRKRCK